MTIFMLLCTLFDADQARAKSDRASEETSQNNPVIQRLLKVSL